MNKLFLSLVLGALVVGSFLVLQATKSAAATVVLPSEIANTPDQNRLRIRVAGRVADAPIEYTLEPLRLEFSLRDPGEDAEVALRHEPVRVVYDGAKPDMFAVGRDVIIDGEYTNGRLHAHKLLTQCPSKYEAPSPEQQYQLTSGAQP
jgi:cytochrome c-type biogenesis protein CcmE